MEANVLERYGKMDAIIWLTGCLSHYLRFNLSIPAENRDNKNGTDWKEEEDKFQTDISLKSSNSKQNMLLSEPSEQHDSDEASDGGWSDDDSGTIKSEITDMSYNTLGSAIVFDARNLTSKDEGTKQLSQIVAAAQQQQEKDKPVVQPLTNSAAKQQQKHKAKPVAQPLTTSTSKKKPQLQTRRVRASAGRVPPRRLPNRQLGNGSSQLLRTAGRGVARCQ